MRGVDLAIYADALAGEAASLAARAERARSRLRQAAIEKRARKELTGVAVERLESLGLLGAASFGNIHGRMEAIAVSRCPCSVASIWCAVVPGSVRVVARRQRRMKIHTPRSPSSPSSTQLRIV